MPISNIIIMGAGPAGLSTALAISQLPSSSPIHITILELRPSTATVAMLGGSINLTPLALRYLDRLGVGDRLRRLGIPVTEKGIELVALRTGAFLGSLWKGADALRVARSDLVACLREAVGKTDGIEIRYGVRVVDVREDGEGAEGSSEVVAVLDDGEEVRGDILLGCDGLHSVARRLYVEPERKEVYSGKVTAYGFAPAEQPADAGVARADGQPALTDSALFTGRYGSIIMSFSEPSRKEIYAAAMMAMEDGHDGKDERDGWKAKGADKAQVKENIMRRFSSTKIPGLDALLGRVEHWTLYPIYMLPPGGRWSRGRVMLLGDAAHAMPPQGESMGVAIEDGVLMARVLQRHGERKVSQVFADYEKLRRGDIDKLFKETSWRFGNAMKDDAGWFGTIALEWMTTIFLMIMGWRQDNYFAKDVAMLELPS